MKNLETKNKTLSIIVGYWCYVTSKKRKINLDIQKDKKKL